MRPSVVSASKSGAVSPMRRLMLASCEMDVGGQNDSPGARTQPQPGPAGLRLLADAARDEVLARLIVPERAREGLALVPGDHGPLELLAARVVQAGRQRLGRSVVV